MRREAVRLGAGGRNDRPSMFHHALAEFSNSDAGRILGRVLAPIIILGLIANWKARKSGKSE